VPSSRFTLITRKTLVSSLTDYAISGSRSEHRTVIYAELATDLIQLTSSRTCHRHVTVPTHYIHPHSRFCLYRRSLAPCVIDQGVLVLLDRHLHITLSLVLRSVDRSVRLGRLGVCPECLMAEVGKRLDYIEVRITERWINTQGESACQALKGKGRKGLCKVFQPKRMRCRDSTKYAQRGCIGDSCRGSTKYTTRTE
jgi:hypothetical protein